MSPTKLEQRRDSFGGDSRDGLLNGFEYLRELELRGEIDNSSGAQLGAVRQLIDQVIIDLAEKELSSNISRSELPIIGRILSVISQAKHEESVAVRELAQQAHRNLKELGDIDSAHLPEGHRSKFLQALRDGIIERRHSALRSGDKELEELCDSALKQVLHINGAAWGLYLTLDEMS